MVESSIQKGIKKTEAILKDLTLTDIEMDFNPPKKFKLNDIINKNSYALFESAKYENKIWNFYFIPLSSNFLKILGLIERFKNIENIQIEDVLDPFLEIGSIICGNIISTITKNLIFTPPILLYKFNIEDDFINGVEIKFEINSLNISGNLLLAYTEAINDEN